MIHGPPAPAGRYSTFHEVLAAAARTRHGVTFVGMQEETSFLSYGEIDRRARRAAHTLVALGIRPGDRVAVGVPTSPRFMDAFFGTMLAGAVPAPLHPCPRSSRRTDYSRDVARLLRVIEPRLVLTDPSVETALDPAVEVASLGCRSVDTLVPDAVGDEAEVSVGRDEAGLIQFSSGSTGTPRGVVVPHRSLVAQTAMLDRVLGAEGHSEDRMVTWLPLYHDMGLIGGLLTPMYMQIPVVIMAPEVFIARPQLWLRAISRHGGTITVAPNFAYDRCMRQIAEAELDAIRLDTLRLALNGAEPVSAALMEAFSRRFARCGLGQRGVMRPVYGLAEATLAVTHPTRKYSPVRWLGVDPVALAREGRILPGDHRLTSVGAPMPGVDLQIRDQDGEELPEGRIGRIFVRTASRMQGYFGDPRATAEVLAGEWLDTGDLGVVDGGELFITGRVKDLVIIRGANHPPQQFEDCLAGLEAVRPGWVVAAGFVPAGSESEELLILAERNPASELGDPAVVKEIRRAILDATGVRAHTVLLLPKGTLRRTTSGKIRRQDARQRFLAGEFTRSGQDGAAG